MNTALYTASYLEGHDASGSSRLERNIRYINYYNSIKEHIGFDDIWLCDNASRPYNYLALPAYKETRIIGGGNTYVYRYSEHLPRWDNIINGYPYCWRALWTIQHLIALGYDKIVAIDSDSFVVSNRMANYIKSLDTGWTTFWIPKYNFPSAECFVLCKDTFPAFLEYTKDHWQTKVGLLMEVSLPFTKVNKNFNCDRWGETRVSQTKEMDGYFQASLDTPLTFNL